MDQSCDHDLPSHHQYRQQGQGRGGDDVFVDENEHHYNNTTTRPERFFLDNIIVGYAFGRKKMDTMGLIMAEASKALSTFECAGTTFASLMNNNRRQWNHLPIQEKQQQQHQHEQHGNNVMDSLEESSTTTSAGASMLTSTAIHGNNSSDDVEKESAVPRAALLPAHYFSDNEEDTRSLSSTYTRSSFISQRSSQQTRGSTTTMDGIQLTFLPDSNGFIHLVRTASSSGGGGGGGSSANGGGEWESVTGSSVTTLAASLASSGKQGASSSSSCSSVPLSLSSSPSKERNEPPNNNNNNNCNPGVGSSVTHPTHFSSRRSNGSSGSRRSNVSIIGGCSSRNALVRRHPIRVSFVPIDLDTPLEEQHGGKFDVILHKMTEDILCMSKMLRARRSRSGGDLEGDGCENDDVGGETVPTMLGSTDKGGGMQPPSEPDIEKPPVEDANPFESTPSMTRHQARASRRIQRLQEYKQRVHPSCVLVDSPNNILAVMSRADMAEVLSRCLAGVTTKGGIPVRTPRFRVVDEDSVLFEAGSGGGGSSASSAAPMHPQRSSLADEIDISGFEYPLIAKPLTAAGTKTSHHMGIVLARDGLQRLKTPCLLQEYANHGETLFKVYVLGESVWVFSRESLPNLPMGENLMNDDAACPMQGDRCGEDDARLWPPRKRPRTESYVEFERPAGSRCYVEFNSQRPYPKLSDFGIVAEETADEKSSLEIQTDVMAEQFGTPRRSTKQQVDGIMMESYHDKEHQRSISPIKHDNNINNRTIGGTYSDLARYVTKDEIEPVTNALRGAFGLELFGFDLLVKHNQNRSTGGSDGDNGKEVLVVDVNYFPGYKEVPNFPSLLAQYLTQKAVESRVRNFDVRSLTQERNFA